MPKKYCPASLFTVSSPRLVRLGHSVIVVSPVPRWSWISLLVHSLEKIAMCSVKDRVIGTEINYETSVIRVNIHVYVLVHFHAHTHVALKWTWT
jgi:hypothetical protein